MARLCEQIVWPRSPLIASMVEIERRSKLKTDKQYFAKLDELSERFPYLSDLDLREVFLTENRQALSRKPPHNSEIEARRIFDAWLKKKPPAK
jgi:hypothetical protein